MVRFFAFIMVIVATMLLVGCGTGSSASAPITVNAVAGDGVITLKWDMQPGVEYWVWGAQGNSITIGGCTSNCYTFTSASSPLVITGLPAPQTPLINGTTYSFTINGRTNGGPGGSGSPSVSAMPRLAGGSWSVGNPLGTQNLHGVAYGVPSVNPSVTPSGLGVFVAAGSTGSNGALFSSTDGSHWVQNSAPLTGILYAATYLGEKFLVVGAGGTILLGTVSADGVTLTWTQETSGITDDLYAVSNNGSEFVATGANGKIITSSDGGVTWAVATSFTSEPIYGITYGNGTYVAVGAAGTLITSPDGLAWATPARSTASDLKGVAYGLPLAAYGYVSQNATVGTFAAVGANGTLVTSSDGVTWTTQNPSAFSSNTLSAITFGHQFVAVDNLGSIFTSTDGTTWNLAQNSSNPLYAVIPATYTGGPYANQFVYSAVGATGANLLAQ